MNKKAVALIFSLLIVALLITLSSATFLRSVSEKYATQKYTETTQAFWLAEAGIQRAIWELNEGQGNWPGWTTNASGDKIISYQLATGEYEVTVSNPESANPVIEAIGYVPRKTTGETQRAIEAEAGHRTTSPFIYAAFGQTSLSMSGNGKTDSYDSSQGSYGGANIGPNGDIGTNGITAGAITLRGNAKVNGDANTGPQGTVTISGNAKVNGQITDDSDQEFPPVETPAELTGLSSSGKYTVSGNSTKTLAAGDYKFSSIKVSGNGKLYISGSVNLYLTNSQSFNISGNGKFILNPSAKVTIYTDGKCNIGGNGIVNQTNLPKNFIVYSTYSDGGDGVKISGNADLQGAIYAPWTRTKISGNGDIYGSVVGNETIITGNGDVHYDEALSNIEISSSRYTIQVWKEESNPYPLN